VSEHMQKHWSHEAIQW